MHVLRISVAAFWAATLFITPALAISEGDDQIIAKLGDASITFADLDAEAGNIKPEHRYGFFVDPERIGDLLENMLLRRSVVKDPETLAAEMGVDLSLYSKAATEKVLYDTQLERMAEQVEVADAEQLAQERYQQNPEEFQTSEAIDVSHLLIRVQDRSEREALDLINELLQRVKDGEAFDALIAEYSEDPSKDTNRGRFDNVTRGRMVEEFEAAAFALEEIGSFSEPVRSQFGYHIIQLHEKTRAEPIPFDQVRDRLVAQIRNQQPIEKRQQVLSNFSNPETELLELAKTSGLVKDPYVQKRIANLVERYLLQDYRNAYIKENTPEDVSAYARELFLSKRKQYKQPLTVQVERVISYGLLDESKLELEKFIESYDSEMSLTEQLGEKLATKRNILIEGTHRGDIAEAAFALTRLGQVSKPIKGNQNWEVLILVNRKEEVQPTFEMVKPALVEELKTKKGQQAWNAYLDQFKLNELWADPEAIASIRDRYQ